MKGVYALIIRIPNRINLRTKSRRFSFEKGVYVYIGSALGQGSTNLRNRLNRHFRTEKMLHWHIDFLLEKSKIMDCIWAASERDQECQIASSLSRLEQFREGPAGFGASDCRSICKAHILRFDDEGSPIEQVVKVFTLLGLEPHLYSETRPT